MNEMASERVYVLIALLVIVNGGFILYFSSLHILQERHSDGNNNSKRNNDKQEKINQGNNNNDENNNNNEVKTNTARSQTTPSYNLGRKHILDAKRKMVKKGRTKKVKQNIPVRTKKKSAGEKHKTGRKVKEDYEEQEGQKIKAKSIPVCNASRYEERQELIDEQCRRYRRDPNLRKYIAVTGNTIRKDPRMLHCKGHILYKLIQKCGSRTILKIFEKKKNCQWRYLQKIKEEQKVILKKDIVAYWNALHRRGHKSFVFVRHPFERLLSAYKNKLEYRGKNTPKMEEASMKMAKKFGANKTQETSTFQHFIRSILAEYKLNTHWTPMTNLVYPCDMTYSYIGKLETFNDDLRCILKGKKYNADDEIHINKSKYKKDDTSQNLRAYFSQISKKQLMRLYTIYRADFDFFGYSMKDYLDFVK